MAVLIDSNILIFSVQHGHPRQEESINAVESCFQKEGAACIFLQNVTEFWNVCTRPVQNNGLGLSSLETERRLACLESVLTFLHDRPEVYREWRRLVVQHEVKGVQVHDARLAAGMIVYGIDRILTYNARDFKRYAGLTVVHPAHAG